MLWTYSKPCAHVFHRVVEGCSPARVGVDGIKGVYKALGGGKQCRYDVRETRRCAISRVNVISLKEVFNPPSHHTHSSETNANACNEPTRMDAVPLLHQ